VARGMWQEECGKRNVACGSVIHVLVKLTECIMIWARGTRDVEELKRRYGSPSQQSNVRDVQLELQLVKMRKVQEMSNNFSNDINPFHVYDKRWGKKGDNNDDGAKFACAPLCHTRT